MCELESLLDVIAKKLFHLEMANKQLLEENVNLKKELKRMAEKLNVADSNLVESGNILQILLLFFAFV